MKDEADNKRILVKQLRHEGNYARRIEDQFSVGFPDLIIIIPLMPIFFVEAKMIPGNVFGPNERQYIELMRLSASPDHAIPCLLGFKESEMYLHRMGRHATIAGSTRRRHGERATDFFRRFYNVG